MKLFSTILVPVDFGDASLQALDAAIELAQKLDASVVAVHAHQAPTLMGSPADLFAVGADDPERVEALEAELRQALLLRRGRGVVLRGLLREGPTAQVIEEAADEVHADLIVLATHGQHSLWRALVGSVADTVARRSHAPVLTLRA